jgi:hypothetical protein
MRIIGIKKCTFFAKIFRADQPIISLIPKKILKKSLTKNVGVIIMRATLWYLFCHSVVWQLLRYAVMYNKGEGRLFYVN